MKFSFSGLFSLFKKPELEISFDPKETAPWPFPVPAEKRKPQVKKATTRAAKKPAAKKTVAKKATTVAKKKTKKAD